LPLLGTLSYFKSWKMMLWKCCTQYASKLGKLSNGHRTGKSQFSFCNSWGRKESDTTEHSLALPFFGIGMKTDFFQSCGHCWVFQVCWHIECSTFTASSFRIWNSSEFLIKATRFTPMPLKCQEQSKHMNCVLTCKKFHPHWMVRVSTMVSTMNINTLLSEKQKRSAHTVRVWVYPEQSKG